MHEKWMAEALAEAEKAAQMGEVPVGAVIVFENEIIARGRNEMRTRQDPTHHAEMQAIQRAATHLGYYRLLGCDLYVTLEPCAMCAGAMVLARIRHCYYGTSDPKTGACQSLMNIPQDERLNHRVELTAGVLAEACRAQLQQFFQQIRHKNG
ncbi:MAG: nucleoside deaminase [Gemmatimonadetes bacterium]|nr:MAG: nucleoside deaminase [Gemmatimonadota bacterium]